MPFVVREFESTPNPNAMKCWLDQRVSAGPRSFLNATAAAANPLAAALFRDADATTVLFCDDWITVNKRPDATWNAVKRKIEQVLAAAPPAGTLEAAS